MIDIRSHILDGSDCGPARFSESLEMCRSAINNGIRIVVATPFWKAGQEGPPLSFAGIDNKILRLIKETSGTLDIKSGFVFEFSTDLPRLVDLYGAKLALGSRDHLLVSLPKTSMPAEADAVWEGLAERRFSVVLTSLECSLALRRNPEALDHWVSLGVKLQVEAASLAGAYGREVQKFAMDCLHRFEGSAVVASTSRSVMSAGALMSAYRLLVNRFGERRALRFVRGTPSAILGEAEARTLQKPEARGSSFVGLLRSLQSIRTLLS